MARQTAVWLNQEERIEGLIFRWRGGGTERRKPGMVCMRTGSLLDGDPWLQNSLPEHADRLKPDLACKGERRQFRDMRRRWIGRRVA